MPDYEADWCVLHKTPLNFSGLYWSLHKVLGSFVCKFQLNPEHKHTAIVVSPLKALMHDQVSFLNQHNISAAAIM